MAARQDDPREMNRRASALLRMRSGRTRGVSVAFLLGGFLCLCAIAFLIAEIVREFRYYNSANSDNVHWALSQAEVEFLEFQRAIHMARMDASPQASTTGINCGFVRRIKDVIV